MAEQIEQQTLKTNHNVRIVNLATGDNVLCMFGDIKEPEGELKYIQYDTSDHYTWHIDMNPTDGQQRKLTGTCPPPSRRD